MSKLRFLVGSDATDTFCFVNALLLSFASCGGLDTFESIHVALFGYKHDNDLYMDRLWHVSVELRYNHEACFGMLLAFLFSLAARLQMAIGALCGSNVG